MISPSEVSGQLFAKHLRCVAGWAMSHGTVVPYNLVNPKIASLLAMDVHHPHIMYYKIYMVLCGMVWFRPITWCFTSRNPHQQSRSGLPAHPTSRPHPPNVESLVEAFARNEPLRPTSFNMCCQICEVAQSPPGNTNNLGSSSQLDGT